MRAPRPRTVLLISVPAAALLSGWYLGITPASLWPDTDHWQVLGEFFAAAFRPTLTSESSLGNDILPRTVKGIWNTVVFAVAAMSLSIVFGSILGVLASERWWRLFPATRSISRFLYGGVRVLIAFLRSIHELLWAIALLAAFGLNTFAGVIAISIPYIGTLAKVFSEMLDEAPDDAAQALRMAGAGSFQVFAFGLLPRALPDMGAYAFYRFECALRSAAILGFFGFPTLGKYIHESCGELYFREAWTYLYALLLLIVAVEWWSGRLRRRLTVA
ncbi:MAG: PhnE/PtxC family ABC transporter permease [Planctomycetota bacterium]|jgi:phosphonate transport system permease protein